VIEIIQIVPHLTPTISGVGDYSLLLAGELRHSHNINTHFIVGDPQWEGPPEIDGFLVTKVSERSASHFESLLRDTAGVDKPLLLEYSGYGYEKRGCPFWLVKGLESWKRLNAKCRLLVMFHELYAFGPPWRSSFWNHALQKWMVKSLAKSSEHSFTNLQRYMRVLRSITRLPEANFSVHPVFSNVGEPNMKPSLRNRKPRLVVFGSAGWRQQAYDQHRNALEKLCQALKITEVIDIGPPCSDIPQISVPCIQKGRLSAEQINRELLNARAGFFSYPVAFLGKSGIFAAYAAHGLVPVTYASNNTCSEDGLRPNEHFLTAASFLCHSEQQIERISQQVHEWYAGHTINMHAKYYSSIIKRNDKPQYL